MNTIILASQSPRRQQLLQWAEIPFEVRVSGSAENVPAGLSPVEAAEHIACDKALSVREQLETNLASTGGYTIIAADTIVVLGNRIIGKPSDRLEAINTLSQLSGKTHEVVTGVCLLSATAQKVFYEETSVSFEVLHRSQIEHYVDHYQPYDKAGAYAIQEWIGVVGIRSIRGDFYNVMGLPVSRLLKELRQFGALPPSPGS